MRRPSPAAIGVVVAVLASGCAHARARVADEDAYRSPWPTPWDYEGRRGWAHWTELDTAYAACNEGRAQSPIDIRAAQPAALPALEFLSVVGPLRAVINNGHTIRVNYRAGNGDSLFVGDRRYELTQFHFHHPAEESVGGVRYPMVAHLMYQDRNGRAAGVAVFIKAGDANATIATVWARAPHTEGQSTAEPTTLNPGDLLPSDVHGYYTYEGSLTAPPCTEGVSWYVLTSPIELSPEQIDAFAHLFPMNARPVQPLNDRVVRQRQ